MRSCKLIWILRKQSKLQSPRHHDRDDVLIAITLLETGTLALLEEAFTELVNKMQEAQDGETRMPLHHGRLRHFDLRVDPVWLHL